VKLWILTAGHADVDKGAVLTPGSGDGTRTTIAVPMYLVETGDARILVDTGMHPVHIDDPHHTFRGSPIDEAVVPVMRDEDRLERRLGELGLGVGDLTHAVNTHLHFDHCGQNGALAGIPILVQRAAYESATAEPGYAHEYLAVPGLDYVLLDGDAEPAPGVRLLAAPGHAPGMQAVLVALPRSGPLLLCGDAIAAREQLDTGNWGAADDPDAAAATAARLCRIAGETGARMVFGHDVEQWGELLHAPDAAYE